MEHVKLSSNWKFDDESKLKNLVSLTTPDNNDCALDHVTQTSCVCLTDLDSNSKPELEITSRNLIKEVKVLSEGSLIEVFGVHGEYLFTCESEFIDDWEGMAVYHTSISLPSISTCKLKFTRTKEKGRLWLYSICLSLSKQEETSHSLFNFENVNKLISNPSQQMSEKAEKFRKFFELYAKNSPTSRGLNVQSLLNAINRECNIQYTDCKQAVTDCLNGYGFKKFGENSASKTDMERKELSVECQFLKLYIDKRFEEMQEGIMKQIEMRLDQFREENNSKLDHIIHLLQESKL